MIEIGEDAQILTNNKLLLENLTNFWLFITLSSLFDTPLEKILIAVVVDN